MNSLLPFMPHGYCFQGRQDVIFLHVASDAIIAFAYFMIPLTLLYFLQRKTLKISFNWAIVLFAAFILLCGITHVVGIITVWNPIYYQEGLVKAATALVSILTAFAIVPLVPKLARMRSPEELEEANQKLQHEIVLREAAQEELRSSLTELKNANAELEQFAYIASHDLQAPLRGISSFSQLLQQRYRGQLDGDGQEFLQFIEAGSQRMHRLINDLLKLSRIGSEKSANFTARPLGWAVAQAAASLKTEIDEAGAVLDVAELPIITAEHNLLVQLFQNLIGNAIKFRRPGVAPKVRIHCELGDEGWHLVVADNGIGIPENQLENIFVVFRRLHGDEDYAGTGIGLSICRKIAEYHRGTITAQPSSTGAEFHVLLPLAVSVSPKPEAAIAAMTG
ncbi:MAG: ATP-binding protein [Pseudomonadota bacterium]